MKPAKPVVLPGARSIVNIAGIPTIELAKIIGITPDIFTLIGRCVFCPPYIFLPTTRFAYWIGILLSAFVIQTMNMIMPIIKAISARDIGIPHHLKPVAGNTRFHKDANILDILAIMFAKRIMEIPLPIPLSLIFSASHITRDAPAQKHATIITYLKK